LSKILSIEVEGKKPTSALDILVYLPQGRKE